MTGSRRLPTACCLLLLSLLLPASAEAQRVTTRPMPQGEVTGLELALDGATSVHRGCSLRWFLTLYEVVGHDSLRPARNARLSITVSDRPDAVVADLRTDGRGRAEVEIPVPESGAGSFAVMIEAASRGVGRTFNTLVRWESSGRVELVADRSEIGPGERVNLVGRVVDLPSGRPLAEQPVLVRLYDQDGRSLGPRVELESDPTGAFVTSFVSPPGATSIRATAASGNLSMGEVTISVSPPSEPRMVVRAVPGRRLVEPGATVPVDVMVRRADGRPVRGAKVAYAGAGWDRAILTDEAGRARLNWRPPDAVGRPPIEDLTARIEAKRAGLGSAGTELALRVARVDLQLGLSVEGGSLLADLPSRVYLRVVRADGEPAPDIPVRLESPILGTLTGRTDAAGVAVLDGVPTIRAGIEGHDRCGGTTSTSAVIQVGEGDDALQMERCMPIDPDGTVRVRPSRPVVTAGGEVELELRVASAAAREPLEVMLLERRGNNLIPAARQVVAPGRDRLSLRLPPEVTGEVVVRVRPLVGGALEPVRGGTAAIWVTPGPRASTTVLWRDGAAVLRSSADGASGAVLVVPAREADRLAERLDRAMTPPFARLLADPSAAPESLIAGWLAARTPRDDAAPAVLRGREVVVMPAPEDPPAHGVLRDPVRARARFVRGRLALVVRTLEQRLDEAIPDRVSDVGVRVRGRWQLNREALSAVVGAHLLAGIDPRTLGGERLTLSDLERLDRSITFDNLARRVTRKRLLALLVRIRDFVDLRDLDLWQGGDDPNLWFRLLHEDTGVEESAFFDGWGNRMRIRRAPGGRARFRFLTPLPAGWELVSAGPDGRFGTGDDLYDPFARVLTSGTPYAEAVAEDELLLRLRRVELSQATLTQVASLFEVDTSGNAQGASPVAARSWDDLPRPLPPAEEVEQFERSWLPIERGPASLARVEGGARLPLDLGDEPRAYEVLSLTWTRDGWTDLTRTPLRAGFPAIVTAEPLARLRPGEPLVVPVIVVALPGGPDELAIHVESTGAALAELASGGTRGPLRPGPGGAAEVRLRVRAERQGSGAVRVSVTGREGGPGAGRNVELPIEVLEPGSQRVQSAAAAVADRTGLRVELPRDATEARGVVVLSRPRAFLGDPTLDRWLDRDPALLAWALAVSGQALPEDLIRRLESATERDGAVAGEEPLLSAACAAVAWAASTEGTHWALLATSNHVASASGSSELDLRAALLAALSVAVGPDDGSPLSHRIEDDRDVLRRSVRDHRDDLGLMARGAAALLLSDWRDVRGRTMLALAREHLAPGFRGGQVVDIAGANGSDADAPGRAGAEQLAATAALAIAAYQAGERDLARELALGLAARAHVAAELGGEPLFWVLAARAFGVFGFADSLAVTLEQDGASRRLELDARPAVVPLALPEPGRRAVIRVAPSEGGSAIPLVHTEVRYLRPARAAGEGPLRAEIDGDPGYVSERAAWVVVVSNAGDAAVERPVLLVTLPSGAQLDATALSAMQRTDGVMSVAEPDRRGVVRVRLSRLPPGEALRLPVPLRWTAAGPRRGLSLAAFPQDRAWELSVTPPVEVDVPFRPEEGADAASD